MGSSPKHVFLRQVGITRKLAQMSGLEVIMEKLKTLPPPKLEEVSDLVHKLQDTSRVEPLAIRRVTSGILSSADADQVEKAIEENCENNRCP